MTRGEFMAAVRQLAVPVPPRPDVIAAAHPLAQLYLAAGGAFNRAGPGAWLWFTKRADEMLDNGAARADFIAWLKKAPAAEVSRFVEAVSAYHVAFCKAAAGAKEKVKRGDGAIDWWRQTEMLAGHMATEARQKSGAGKNSAKKRGDPVKTEVLRLAEKEMSKRIKSRSRWDLAGEILCQLDKEKGIARSQDHIDGILKEAGILPPVGPRVSKAARNLVRPLGLPPAEEETASRMIVALQKHLADALLDRLDLRMTAYGRDRIKSASVQRKLDASVLALEKARRARTSV
jgi:hypothetical protein